MTTDGILEDEDVPFSAYWMATTAARNGLTVRIGRQLVDEYADCPHCGASIEVRGSYRGTVEDRDVVFDSRSRGSYDQRCAFCGATIRILVEEKVWGIVSPDDEDAFVEDLPDDVVAIRFEYPHSGEEAILTLNLHQLMVRVAEEPDDPASEDPERERAEAYGRTEGGPRGSP